MILNWRVEEKNFELNNEIKTIESLCFGPIGVILSLGNLKFLKLACLFYEHQMFEGQLSIDSSSTEKLYCLNRH